jgi:ParB family chromosome partitioning protein
LSYPRCESLINSIKEEGRNREAVVVRRTNDPCPMNCWSARRHWSVSWLHANNHSEVEFIARIETLDDEGAFRLADLENREREDVTDLERAEITCTPSKPIMAACARGWPRGWRLRQPACIISSDWGN